MDTRADNQQHVEFVSHLDVAQVAAVVELAGAAAEADGVHPLSEHVMLHLHHGGEERGLNALAYVGASLAGYGHLDITDLVTGASAEVLIHPDYRRRGCGRALVMALMAEAPNGHLRLWAHGAHPAAAALAASMGFSQSRVLWQMRRSLYADLPAPEVPPGVTVRAFVPGRDEADWVELNHAAFAGHPEQQGWSLPDLELRLGEPWFDPNGFFLAERENRLVGFHWTKVHGGNHGSVFHPGADHHGHPPIGEVYVLGVHPAEHGRGLGRALTLVGLRHLRQRGLPDAMLYVEADNKAAIGLYTNLGFTRWETDVMFSRDAAE